MYIETVYRPNSKTVMKLPIMYQFDRGIKVRIKELPKDGRRFKLEACLEGDQFLFARCEQIGIGDYALRNDLFTDGRNIHLFLFAEVPEEAGRTLQEWVIPIIRRPSREIEVTIE